MNEEVCDDKVFLKRDPKMTELARNLSGLSKNAGTVGFIIKYTATDPNIRVHEEFQRFAFEEANNEYLLAISKLLDHARFSRYFEVMDQRLSALEAEVYKNGLQEEKKEVESVPKKGGTF